MHSKLAATPIHFLRGRHQHRSFQLAELPILPFGHHEPFLPLETPDPFVLALFFTPNADEVDGVTDFPVRHETDFYETSNRIDFLHPPVEERPRRI